VERLVRLGVRVAREHAEAVLVELLEFAPGGLEEVEVDAGTVEYALYGPPGELPTLPQLQVAAGGGLVEVRGEEVAADWQQRWRAFHRPQAVAIEPGAASLCGREGQPLRGFWIKPPWADPTPDPALAELVVDPGMAFGTGAHPTTKLALELLLAQAAGRAHGPLYDLGCGSGVVAIAGWLLGYGPVVGLDNDPRALEATAANAALAGAQVEARLVDLARDRLPPLGGEATVVANLLRPLLVLLAQRLAEPPAALVISGLLRGEGRGCVAAFQRRGLELVELREQGGWEAALLRSH